MLHHRATLPTPLPAPLLRRSSSWILGLMSAPDWRSHARNAWLAWSKSAMRNVDWSGGWSGCECTLHHSTVDFGRRII